VVNPESSPSLTTLQKCLASEDGRFVDEFRRCSLPAVLIEVLPSWMSDERPWAREQIKKYLLQEPIAAGHPVVIKRMYKHFEKCGDPEILPLFLVSFDRLIRHRSSRQRMSARKQKDSPADEQSHAQSHGEPEQHAPGPDKKPGANRGAFQRRTRTYLRRRVWRYFRRLSYLDASVYRQAIVRALIHYQDSDFHCDEHVLDNWSLMHACYFHHPILQFTTAHTNLRAGASLSSLSAAPYRPEVWQTSESTADLIQLLSDAQSRRVRNWAMELFLRDHSEAVQEQNPERLLSLVTHSDLRVRQFAAAHAERHPGLASTSVTFWLDLAHKADAAVLPWLCRLMKQVVDPEPLETSQIVELTTAEPTPLAELGFEWLKACHAITPLNAEESGVSRKALAAGDSPTEPAASALPLTGWESWDRLLGSLALARCEALSAEICEWALAKLSALPDSDADSILGFFDSSSKPMRSAALTWLATSPTQGNQDPALWSRLAESPWDDVRLTLAELLQDRAISTNDLDVIPDSLWCSVLLSIHQGSRLKARAIDQIRLAIEQRPAQTDTLLPALAVAVRSLRAPERRSALAAIAGLLQTHPELHPEVQRHLPELEVL
jgi:hypothetical protein